MAKVTKQAFSIKSNAVFILSLTSFAILFVVLYDPRYGYDNDTFWQQWKSQLGFFVSILSSIMLVCTAISRALLIVVARNHYINKRDFLFWLMLEIVVTCLFCDLFLCLYLRMGFFDILLHILTVGFSINIIPYVVYWFILELQERNDTILEAQKNIEGLRRGLQQSDDTVVQFFDDKDNAKLLVSLDKIYSVESAANYVNIVYESDGKILRFSLRNSMKGVEQTCEQNGLVRCHRSYYINLRKVKLIRKDSYGTFAEMQNSALSDIPISKVYASEVAHQFSTRI